jgi:hypothetical protein
MLRRCCVLDERCWGAEGDRLDPLALISNSSMFCTDKSSSNGQELDILLNRGKRSRRMFFCAAHLVQMML